MQTNLVCRIKSVCKKVKAKTRMSQLKFLDSEVREVKQTRAQYSLNKKRLIEEKKNIYDKLGCTVECDMYIWKYFSKAKINRGLWRNSTHMLYLNL